MYMKLAACAVAALILAALLVYVYKLRADLADQAALIGRQTQMIADREAAIKGYVLEVNQKSRELAAVSAQADHIRETLGATQRRMWDLEDLLTDAQNVPAKPGEVVDDATSRKVVAHLNGFLAAYPSVRKAPAPSGDKSPNTGEVEPLPQAVFERPGDPTLGADPAYGPYEKRPGDTVEPRSDAVANQAP